MAAKQSKQTSHANWFDERPSDSQIPQSARRLLETYSGIAPDNVIEHIIQVRNEAWNVHPYPCLGQFRFLEAGLDQCEEYNEVVERLCSGQKLLDMACCVGQTIRQLVADGAPSKNIYGCDLQPNFIELGYKLFRDRDKLETRFLVADIFDPNSALQDPNVKCKLDMIYAGSFFHLWGLEQQKQVSKVVASLMNPQPGSLILGRQIGAVEAAEKTSATGTMFRHNAESFKKMWKEIGDDLGFTFAIEAHLKMLNDEHFESHTNDQFQANDTRRIWFSIRMQ
ncbi:hypothetical protein BKA63DRAFT_563381 [Paraphoma chrysanthemicola]|nr:hypothetical protein BKA63DRAFT_563381 [Paraphoma chrysanthemicola]